MSNLVEQLKRHEGLRLKPYKDSVGKLTIGYGRNLDDFGITEQEASLMLMHNIEAVADRLMLKLPRKVITNLNEERLGVLVNMAFNMGVNGLFKFKKMLKALKVSDYDEACRQMMDSKWAAQVGVRAVELSEQMRTGVYK